MLPPAHYSAGLAAGLAVYKLTGSPAAGGSAAFLSHMPLDWLVNEFHEWGEGRRGLETKAAMALLCLPAGLALLVYSLTHPWLASLYGGLGLGMDAIDLAVKWLTARLGVVLRTTRKNETTGDPFPVVLHGIELFICHYRCPWYIGQAFRGMVGFGKTAGLEILTAGAVLLSLTLALK